MATGQAIETGGYLICHDKPDLIRELEKIIDGRKPGEDILIKVLPDTDTIIEVLYDYKKPTESLSV